MCVWQNRLLNELGSMSYFGLKKLTPEKVRTISFKPNSKTNKQTKLVSKDLESHLTRPYTFNVKFIQETFKSIFILCWKNIMIDKSIIKWIKYNWNSVDNRFIPSKFIVLLRIHKYWKTNILCLNFNLDCSRFKLALKSAHWRVFS